MKKLCLALFLIIMISTSAFSQGISLGLNGRATFSFLRGNDYEKYVVGKEEEPSGSFSGGIDVILFPFPFLGVEMGAGLTMATKSLISEQPSQELLISRVELSIPFLLRLQHEYDIGDLGGVTYASFGARLGFNLLFNSYGYITDVANQSIVREGEIQSNDIVFALGQEIRIGTSDFIGLRAQYNLNFLSPIVPSLEVIMQNRTEESWYHDYFEISLTYRHMFAF